MKSAIGYIGGSSHIGAVNGFGRQTSTSTSTFGVTGMLRVITRISGTVKNDSLVGLGSGKWLTSQRAYIRWHCICLDRGFASSRKMTQAVVDISDVGKKKSKNLFSSEETRAPAEKINRNVKAKKTLAEESVEPQEKKGRSRVKAVQDLFPDKKNETSIPKAAKRTIVPSVSKPKKATVKGEEQHVIGDKAIVVVVESPVKAKTIEKYLGEKYVVMASYGHVRDLAGKSGSVRPHDDYSLVWEVPEPAQPRINQIKIALKGASALVLASDPDREGEAIAWHLLELLKLEGALTNGIAVQRVTFNEITKKAVEAGMMCPRDISQTLVDACLARRALDYLIGFDISPLLWRKLPGSKSAGRVQSAALCLLCERETEIDAFIPREYWTVDCQLLAHASKTLFPARLTHYAAKKLEQFTLTPAQAKEAAAYLSSCEIKVANVKKSVVRRNPPGPYITSSLQQDASSKLGFGATKTMQLAQKLYEGVSLLTDELVGLITYMRTDSLQLSNNAVESIRCFAEERYGKNYVPEKPNNFKSKVKNAQEAHEAIRPTDISRLPSTLAAVLEPDALSLYALIWRRTVACQMEQAVFSQVALDFQDPGGCCTLHATGFSIAFPGYQAVLKDTDACGVKSEEECDVTQKNIPSLKVEDPVSSFKVLANQHSTEPPPRYTEGSLVRKLEELGIGRPSTYSHILKTLQTRQYTRSERQRVFPEIRGRMVAAFLFRYFPEFVDYGFTAKMEEQLDAVSNGTVEWKEVLRQFWPNFHDKVASTLQVPNDQISSMLQELFSGKLVGKHGQCPKCQEGTVVMKLTRFGAGYFFGCNRHPICDYIANQSSVQPKILGEDPNTHLPVSLRLGPFGPYLQLGDTVKGKKKTKDKSKLKRVSLPEKMKLEDVDLDAALELLRYPVTMGEDSEGRTVELSVGKFGYCVKVPRKVAYLPEELSVEDLTLEKAVELIEARKPARLRKYSSGI